MPVDLQIAIEPAPRISVQSLNDAVGALVQVIGDERLSREICVRICDRDESRQLNSLYRHQDKPTNVLSFAADDDFPGAEELLGDLAVCWPVVIDEAHQQGKRIDDHLAHLFVHGVLHLLGYDHDGDADAAAMESLEVRTLARLGIAHPYEACD